MDADRYADMFRFRLGARVRWAEYPADCYEVGQRRWTEREILEPLVSYRLRRITETGARSGIFVDWIREHDLMPWQEDA